MILNLAKQNLNTLTDILNSINNKVHGLSDPNFVVKKIDFTAAFEKDCEILEDFDLNENLLTSKQEEYINLSYMFNENNTLKTFTGLNEKFENHLKLLEFDGEKMCKNCKQLTTAPSFSKTFKDCTSLSKLILSNIFQNCSSINNTICLAGMALNCQNLMFVDLSYGFHNCTKLISIESFHRAFENCPNLQLVNMSHMFDGCYNLKEVSISGIFGTSNCKKFDVSGIFAGCNGLILYLDHYFENGELKENTDNYNLPVIYRECIKELPNSSLVAIKEERMSEIEIIKDINGNDVEIMGDELIKKMFRVPTKRYYRILTIGSVARCSKRETSGDRKNLETKNLLIEEHLEEITPKGYKTPIGYKRSKIIKDTITYNVVDGGVTNEDIVVPGAINESWPIYADEDGRKLVGYGPEELKNIIPIHDAEKLVELTLENAIDNDYEK